MDLRPGFTGRTLIATDDEDCDIRFLRVVDRALDGSLLCCGVHQMYIVGPPAAGQCALHHRAVPPEGVDVGS